MFSGVKSGVLDQPLTFHSKVKSSGYSAVPRYDFVAAFTLIAVNLAITPRHIQSVMHLIFRGHEERGTIAFLPLEMQFALRGPMYMYKRRKLSTMIVER